MLEFGNVDYSYRRYAGINDAGINQVIIMLCAMNECISLLRFQVQYYVYSTSQIVYPRFET